TATTTPRSATSCLSLPRPGRRGRAGRPADQAQCRLSRGGQDDALPVRLWRRVAVQGRADRARGQGAGGRLPPRGEGGRRGAAAVSGPRGGRRGMKGQRRRMPASAAPPLRRGGTTLLTAASDAVGF